MSTSAERRASPVYKAMNRPLTVLGAERRLFFVALISGGVIFSLLHSLLRGIGLFIVALILVFSGLKAVHCAEERSIVVESRWAAHRN